jgi:hypothetical protein
MVPRAVQQSAEWTLWAVGEGELDLTQVAYLALGVTSSRT